jgi:hypothetical protein
MRTAAWKGEGDVGEPHEHRVHPAAIESRDEAKGHANQGRDALRHDPDHEGNPCSEEDAAQDVATLAVGPEQVRATGREEIGRAQVASQGIMRGDQRSEEGRHDDKTHEDQTDATLPLTIDN